MSVSVLTFRSGETLFALAAGSVVGVGPALHGAPHLADVLPNLSRGDHHHARSLRVAVAGDGVDVTVDGPIKLAVLSPTDIAPSPFRASAAVRHDAAQASGRSSAGTR